MVLQIFAHADMQPSFLMPKGVRGRIYCERVCVCVSQKICRTQVPSSESDHLRPMTEHMQDTTKNQCATLQASKTCLPVDVSTTDPWNLRWLGGEKNETEPYYLVTYGHGSKARLPPSEHPNPTTKIGSKMGGEPTPKCFHWF